jgi:ribosomal protein S18 acetylase RimI-like enzyme
MAISLSELQFKKLDDSDDLSRFECTDPELDEYLKEDALDDQRGKISVTRLATHRDYVGNGVGRAMLLRTMAISSQLSLHVGCRFITVDAKNRSVGFYEKFGFVVAKTREKTTSMYRNVPA